VNKKAKKRIEGGKNMKKLVVLLVVLTMVATLFAGCAGDGGGEKGADADVEKVFRFPEADEPPALDPGKTTDTISFTIGQGIFEGLYRYHNGEYVDGMAEGEPDVSEDGLTWTFHLRDAKWSDGKAVTAHDFEYAWKRALNPETASKYAFIIGDYVKGGNEYNAGEGSADDVGVKALDEKTLEVTLKQPTPYFKSLTTFGTYLPVREDVVEEHGDAFASDPDKMVYNGPFVLARWDHDSELEYHPNPEYWNKEKVNFTKVITPIVRDASTAINMYETGELDMVGLSGEFAEKYMEEGKALEYHDGGTFYLMFNGEKYEPFKNENIRKALTLAIDRDNYIKNVWQIPYVSATNFVNPALMGNEKSFREEYKGDYFKTYDPEAAKEYLAKGLEELGLDSLPKFEFLTDDGEMSTKSTEFIQENWRKNLGVEIDATPVPFQVRLDRSDKMDYDVVLSGWGPDYDDPMTFMDMWVTDGTFNEVKFSNKDYDEKIKAAKASADNAERMKLMAEAEEILMDGMPIAPLYHRVRVYTVADGVTGISRGAFNPDPDWMFGDIEAQ
jgi:oligopeptide transport system substrate-binding protein